ncbi:hypothetical protein Kurepalu1_00032 [Pseudomonas phage vB_PpuP-Kurepalu-1]
MNPHLQLPIFRGLSDSLQVCISCGNQDAVSSVLVNAKAAADEGAITKEQFDELVADAREEGFDYV